MTVSVDSNFYSELHIESSSRCNASCPMCPRNILGKELNPMVNPKDLSLEWISENLSDKQIQYTKKIMFCGNLGDPASCADLIDIIKYIKKVNNNCVIGLNTNGGLRSTSWWSKLAQQLVHPLDYVVFSIDGLEDTNHIYRKGVIWNKLIENAQSYIDNGGTAHWDMLVFEHNKHQVDDCIDLAKALGFSWFRSKQTDRWDVYDSQDIDIHPPQSYTSIDYKNLEVVCERDQNNSVYIDAHGNYWPCCHLAEASANPFIKDSEVKNISNTDLFELYKNRIKQNNPLLDCRRRCGIVSNASTKRSQWKQEIQLQ